MAKSCVICKLNFQFTQLTGSSGITRVNNIESTESSEM